MLRVLKLPIPDVISLTAITGLFELNPDRRRSVLAIVKIFIVFIFFALFLSFIASSWLIVNEILVLSLALTVNALPIFSD